MDGGGRATHAAVTEDAGSDCPDRHREDARQFVQSIFKPLPPVFERLGAQLILTTQKRAPHAAEYAVIESGSAGRNQH